MRCSQLLDIFHLLELHSGIVLLRDRNHAKQDFVSKWRNLLSCYNYFRQEGRFWERLACGYQHAWQLTEIPPSLVEHVSSSGIAVAFIPLPRNISYKSTVLLRSRAVGFRHSFRYPATGLGRHFHAMCSELVMKIEECKNLLAKHVKTPVRACLPIRIRKTRFRKTGVCRKDVDLLVENLKIRNFPSRWCFTFYFP